MSEASCPLYKLLTRRNRVNTTNTALHAVRVACPRGLNGSRAGLRKVRASRAHWWPATTLLATFRFLDVGATSVV